MGIDRRLIHLIREIPVTFGNTVTLKNSDWLFELSFIGYYSMLNSTLLLEKTLYSIKIQFILQIYYGEKHCIISKNNYTRFTMEKSMVSSAKIIILDLLWRKAWYHQQNNYTRFTMEKSMVSSAKIIILDLLWRKAWYHQQK